MIAKPVIITGLDISSSKISAVMTEISGAGNCVILAHESQPSKGVYRGAFMDIAEASNSVSSVLKRIGEKTGKKACGF